ncbi:LytR family transcriptional regulator [Geobacillus stearothermophilus]|uniref:LytR family transcriptional regulator n=1 Tax=Geobacillus stearothermophilus TaxID=1422 RepID=UPI003D1C7FC6
MSSFQQLPKSVKKTIRYILQDVHSLEKLEWMEKTIHYYIQKRKKELNRFNWGGRAFGECGY